MNRMMISLLLAGGIVFSAGAAGPAPAGGLKVFISVDMEGVSGLINWEETSASGRDYELFRRAMTEDANAAIDGALRAGACCIFMVRKKFYLNAWQTPDI